MRALLATAIALMASGIALAQDDGGAVPDGDDTRSRADIASVRAAHDTSNDRLAHIVRFHQRITARAFDNEINEHGPPGSVCINIWTGRTPWDASPNFEVCVSANRDASDLVASVTKLGPRGGARRRGAASAELTTGRRLVVRFDPDLIRRPTAYRWVAQVTTFERGCTSRGCEDFAPRRGRSVRTELGTPTG